MRKDTRNDLLVLINTIDNLDDLNKIKSMVNDRSASLARQTKYDLIIGEKVTISGSSKIETGKIIKINRTRAVVDCYDKVRECMIHYTVPFSMIRKVAKTDGA